MSRVRALRRAPHCVLDAARVTTWPLGMRLRPGNVAMLHIGRCGSQVVGYLLNCNRRVMWDKELFERHLERREKRWSLRRDPSGLVTGRLKHAGMRWYGFETKFLPQQHLHYLGMNLEEFLDRLEQLGFSRFVLLRRRNLLRRMLSHVIATSSGVYHLRDGDTPVKRPVELDLRRIREYDSEMGLLEWFSTIEEAYGQAEEHLAARDWLDLWYEDDIAPDPRIAYRKICQFLGVPVGDTPIRHRKTNPFRIDELILNYDDVRRLLDGTSRAWMLEAGADHRCGST